MKRVLLLLAVLAVCAAGYLSIWGYLPVVPVIGAGQEPSIKPGSLLVTAPLIAEDIQKGDIVVVKTPDYARERYDYPPLTISRITEINTTSAGLELQTSVDFNGNDPFYIRLNDIQGSVQYRIPYLGLPLVFLNSAAGTVFIIFCIILLALYLYSDKISGIMRRNFREFISPVMEENQRVNLVLSNRFESTEKALVSFAGAMQEYAQHMASHTSAIKGLSEASIALKDSAAEQNRILSSFTHTLEIEKSTRDVSQVKRVVSDLERRTSMILQVKDQLEGRKTIPEVAVPRDVHSPVKVQSTPGCAIKSGAFYVKGHYFTRSSSFRSANN